MKAEEKVKELELNRTNQRLSMLLILFYLACKGIRLKVN
jgi:hypothetical protein